MYKKEDVKLKAVEYFGDELTANVWYDKYCLKDGDNILESSPFDTIVRLGLELNRIEQKHKKPMEFGRIMELMNGYKKFVMAGSPLFGIGNSRTLSTLGNCFVVDSPIDSYGGIMKTDQEIVQIMKRRGGVGMDISSLRPKRSAVRNAAASSTGAVSFMSRFSNTTREVAQEGRRGALMLTMDISHPDIAEYVMAKDDLKKLTGANISVKITDDFMKAVMKDELFPLMFNGKQYGSIRAMLLWRKIVHQAWKNAEPGILFWDRIVQESPADCYENFKTISTNPCSELPLCAYDSCRISAINVYEYVKNPFEPKPDYDFDALYKDAYDCQRLMDDVIDLEDEKIIAIMDKIRTDPEPDHVKDVEMRLWYQIQYKLMMGRRTGLGQMGLADAGAAMGLRYGSEDFNFFSEEISKTIAKASYASSIDMAQERGAFIAFDYDKEKDSPFINRILNELGDDYKALYSKYGRRNIANLTIAPTGSISMLSRVSSGIEPVFALSYSRRRKVTEDNPDKTYKDPQGDWWETYEVFHPKYAISQSIHPKYATSKSSAYHGSSAHEVSPEQKLIMQSMIQPWIDHSISVTYNLPANATEKDVSDLYFNAWGMGLKGLTVYRDGSRDGILSTNKKVEFQQHDAPKRPKSLKCNIHNVKSKGLDWTVCVGMLDNKPYEVFAVQDLVGKGNPTGEIVKLAKGRYDLKVDNDGTFENITDGCPDDQNLLTRMISTSLRHGADIKFIVEQLDKSTGDITSFGKAISRSLRKYLPDSHITSACPECGSKLQYHDGCIKCSECSYSKCS